LGDMQAVFVSADLRMVNLECPLTNSNVKIRKSGPHLKARPEAIEWLKAAGINLVTLANNHLMDFGVQGYQDTIAALNVAGIEYTGSGENLTEAALPKYIEIKGRKIAILNFCSREFSIATTSRAGAYPIDAVDNYLQIIEAKANSDYQIIIVHAGIEHYAYPTPNQMKLYRFYASLGVSAVISHHSHCRGGYEVYKGVPIFYGLGNFVFPEEGNPLSWYEGLLLELNFLPTGGLSYETYKFKQVFSRAPYALKLTEKAFPPEINTNLVNDRWLEYVSDHARKRNLLNNLQQRGFLQRVWNKWFPQSLKWGFDSSYLNLLRNEANYEYIIKVLEEICGE
jgi:hypothetical protein